MELKERAGSTGCRSPSENTGADRPRGAQRAGWRHRSRDRGERDRGGRVSQGRGWGRGRMGGTGQRETGKEWTPAPEWQK